MNTERRWVIFDLGKVLLDFDFAIAAKELARYSPQEEEQILESINQSPLLHTFERGDWSEAQFFQKLSVECRLKPALRNSKKVSRKSSHPFLPWLDSWNLSRSAAYR